MVSIKNTKVMKPLKKAYLLCFTLTSLMFVKNFASMLIFLISGNRKMMELIAT